MNPSLGNRNSQHSFARVPTANTPRSKFDRSFAAKDTMEFDYLTPMFVDEILPGDTINLNVKCFMRLAPQVVPMMENMYLDFYFFFVPNRLIYDNFQKLMGEQDNPGDSIDFLMPILDTTANPSTLTVGTIYDHFGLPTDVNLQNAEIQAAPFRAYNLIWNQWFRSQDLQNSVTVPKGNGPDARTTYTLLKGGKKHDYFTSSLPFAQKGTAVDMPILGTTPITSTNSAIGLKGLTSNATGNLGYYTATTNRLAPTTAPGTWTAGESLAFGASTGLQADFLDAASTAAITISAFREAMQLQAFLEQDARGGTRYTEILKSHFNVVSPDARLQRTEFLSGATINITQHPVPQTSESGTTPQANLAAFSTAASMGNRIGFNKSFVEHGWVIGLVKARADITYQQGLNKMWSRRTRYDFFWPKFQELSEQIVYLREIYAQPGAPLISVWGYQERYAEYRYRPSEIKGQFRSTYSTSLDVYHLAEEFGSAPALNGTFIQSNTPIDRALAVGETFELLADYWFDYKHIRPMVTYPVPVGLGRF